MELSGLIVGLGNPGAEYEKTRHNYGFMVVDALLRECEKQGEVTRLSGQRDPYHLWRAVFPDRKGIRRGWLITTPLTYMNKSGEAVQRIAAYYHIPPQDILVLHDELDLPLGRMKLKAGGGSAGHNGIRSIQQQLGTPEFSRLRLGIGKPAGRSGASYVLGRFAADQQEALDKTIDAAVAGILLLMREGTRNAQQFCNGFSLEPKTASAPKEPASENEEKIPPRNG